MLNNDESALKLLDYIQYIKDFETEINRNLNVEDNKKFESLIMEYTNDYLKAINDIKEQDNIKPNYRHSKKEIIAKKNALKENIKKVEDEIKELEKKDFENTKEKNYKQAYNVSLEFYFKNFNFNVNVKEINDKTYTAEFKEVKDNKTLNIIVKFNRQNHNIIDFEADFLTEQKEELYQKYVVEKGHFPALILYLRNVIFDVELKKSE